MRKMNMIGYGQALALTLGAVTPLTGKEAVRLDKALGRVLYEDMYSQVDSPSIDASMKDGYAVRSGDIAGATFQNHVTLTVTGSAAAGGRADLKVMPGTAVRILTGAKIPDGADAVLAGEFAVRQENRLTVLNTAEPGRNILQRGADVKKGELIASKGDCLSPGLIGMITAAGLGELPVYPCPKVAILATGDELLVPGQPIEKGKLYASNLEMLKAWCLRYQMDTSFLILNDQPDVIRERIRALSATHDALLTSGGAWTGDRDFVGATLDRLGWEEKFHFIRIGPGKPVGFGLLNRKPVFLLPGGPPSNLTAFLQIAMPGLLTLGGHGQPSLPRITVTLDEAVHSRKADWTQFIYGHIAIAGNATLFRPLRLTSRLKSMAGAQGVIAVPEGVKSLPEGAVVTAQLLI